jgi:hypothetical protein
LSVFDEDDNIETGFSTCKETKMIQTIEGVFRNGKVELSELPKDLNDARVIVTFLPTDLGPPDGPSFTPEELVELRGKLQAWEDDWNAPGMEAYDEYETRRRGPGAVPPQ